MPKKRIEPKQYNNKNGGNRNLYSCEQEGPGEETEAILQIIAVFDAIKEPNSYET